MNMENEMKTYLVAAAVLSLASNAFASTESKWAGSGNLYGADGAANGSYQLELTVTRISDTESQQAVKVILPDGSVENYVSHSTKAGNGFEVSTETMKGGGFCFSDDLCTIYLENAATGTAFSTTLIHDGDQKMRQLRTELKQGKVQRFYAESFVRVE
jgi:hypothetical protein